MPQEYRMAMSRRRATMCDSHIARARDGRYGTSKQAMSTTNTSVGSVFGSQQVPSVHATAADDRLETYLVESDDGSSTSIQQLYDEARAKIASLCARCSSKDGVVKSAMDTDPAVGTDMTEMDEGEISMPAARAEAANNFHDEGFDQEKIATNMSHAQVYKLMTILAQHVDRLERVEKWYLLSRPIERIDQLEQQQCVFSRQLDRLDGNHDMLRRKQADLEVEFRNCFDELLHITHTNYAR